MAKNPHVRYQPAIGKKICDLLSTGRSLTEICSQDGMPNRHSVRAWVVKYPQFRAEYDRAREWWWQAQAEDIIELASNAQQIAQEAAQNGGNPSAAVNALRVEIDVKRWAISKWISRYADQIAVTGAAGKDLLTQPVELDATKAALCLMQLLNAGRKPDGDPSRPAAVPYAPSWKLDAALTAPIVLPAEPEELAEPKPPRESAAEIRERLRWARLTGPRWGVIE